MRMLSLNLIKIALSLFCESDMTHCISGLPLYLQGKRFKTRVLNKLLSAFLVIINGPKSHKINK